MIVGPFSARAPAWRARACSLGTCAEAPTWPHDECADPVTYGMPRPPTMLAPWERVGGPPRRRATLDGVAPPPASVRVRRALPGEVVIDATAIAEALRRRA